MSVQPRPAYTPSELAELYPPSLRLQQVQVLMRHGERTPVSNRFASAGLPEFWPYCTQASRMTSAVLDPASATWTALDWKRRLETFSRDSQTPALGGGGGGDAADNLCELGQLTDKGRETATALGARLRRLYVDQLGFLPARLESADDLYLRSTPMPRALESMQQALHGLYPPAARAAGLPRVAIHTRHWGDDTLLPNTANCQRFAQLMRAFGRRAAERWDDSPEMDRINAKLRKYMPRDPSPSSAAASSSQNVRIGVASHPALVGVMDTIAATAAHDAPATKLPRDFYDARVYADAVTIVVDEWFAGFRESAEYRTLGIGGLLADMTERMVGSAEGVLPHSSTAGAPLRFALSGCHDTTLAATVTSLGADGPEGTMRWPPFTSHVAVELLRDESAARLPGRHVSVTSSSGAASWIPAMLGGGARRPIGRRPTYELTSGEKERLSGYYVRVRYNDEPLKIPGCRPAGKHYGNDESLCTLAAFKSIVDRITPTDWKAQCGANLDQPTIPNKPEPAGY